MHLVRLLGLLPLLSIAFSSPLKTSIRIAGGEIATNTYEEMPDGTFKSETHGALGPSKIDTTVTGLRDKGKIVKVAYQQTTNGQVVCVTFDHGKVTVTRPNTKPATIESKFTGGAFFSTFHPQLWRSLLPLTPDMKSLKVFLMEGATTLDMPVAIHSPRTSNGQKVTSITLDVTGIKIDVFAAPDDTIVYFNVPVQKFSGLVAGYESLAEDPMAKFPELSQATEATTQDLDEKVKMRDGVELATDVTRPKRPGKYPTILVRTAYGKASDTLQGAYWASRGYVYVTQDVRGRGGSAGDWDPFVNERKDGFDTIAWVAAQDWCNGNVGMIGGSYLGYVQWAAAIEKPPALKCIIPQVSPPPLYYNIPYENGAFFLAGDIWWSFIVRGKDADFSSLKAMPHPQKLLTLPLSKVDDATIGMDVPFYDKWLQRDTPAKMVGSTTLEEIARVQIPVLHISGTWDGDGVGTKLHWQALDRVGKKNQWLIFGPWEHGFNVSQKHADVDYGPQSLIDLDSVYLRYFDTFLKGKSVGWEKTPRVRLFETGANRWVNLSQWPNFPDFRVKALYLTASGSTKGLDRGGHLLPYEKANITRNHKTSVSSKEPSSSYIYDPAHIKIDPAQTSPEDASTRLPRKRIKDGQLYFRSDPFARPALIAGPLNVTLFVSTSARDATFHCVVLDEDAAGAMRVIAMPGTTRLTYRNEILKPEKVEPNKVYRLTLRPWWFAHQFAKGHRLTIMVTSDMFPGFARNPGTGEPDATATKLLKAVQTVYHGGKYPSIVEFEIKQ